MAKYANPLKPKQEKTKTYIFTDESLAKHDEDVKAKAMPDIICYANAMITAAIMLTCRDKLKYGKKRITRFYENVEDVFQSIVSGYLNYYDIHKQLQEECEINIVIETPEGKPVNADEIFMIVSGMPMWRIDIKGEMKK